MGRSTSRGAIRIGISGWRYEPWRGTFYPAGLAQARELEYASRQLRTIEINGSFYVQIARETYRRWRDETPDDTRFAVKGHRFVTHYKRLRDVDRSVALLRDQARGLGDKLDVVLWQLPANLQADARRLREFLRALRRWRGVRHAIELRHRS